MNCSQSGITDISLASSALELESSQYRIHKDGKVRVSNKTHISHSLKPPIEQGSDYKDTEEEDLPEVDMIINKNGLVITIDNVNRTCCRPVRTRCYREDGDTKCV